MRTYAYIPTISVTLQNDSYTIQVIGRFGGGYICPGKTVAEAAAMVIRDSPRYDCGDSPLVVLLPAEVQAEIEVMMARGKALAACLTCRLRAAGQEAQR